MIVDLFSNFYQILYILSLWLKIHISYLPYSLPYETPNYMCMCAKSFHSCPTLCDPMDCSPPGSSVHGILQTRILEWVAMASPGDLPDPGMEPTSPLSPALASVFFTTSATWEAPLKRISESLSEA